ncbi:MAG: hypothetical protein ACT4OM_13420 [Actinomycetota bacterium]
MAHTDGVGPVVTTVPWKIIVATVITATMIATAVVVVVRPDQEAGTGTTVAEGLTQSEQDADLGTTTDDPGRMLTAADLRWEQFGLFTLPVSDAGPKDRDGVSRWGFERTPAGAVMAAIHIPSAASASNGPTVFERTIADQVVGPDKNAFLATVRSEYSASTQVHGASANGELGPERASDVERMGLKGVWAYRLDSFTSDTVTVQILSLAAPPNSEPIYPNFSVTVKWVEGDWRLVAPVDGSWRSYARNLRTIPAAYVVIGRDAGTTP